MDTSDSTRNRTATGAGGGRWKSLIGMRRTQLLLAVLFGAIIGGGFTAVAFSTMIVDGHGPNSGYSTGGPGFGDHPGFPGHGR